MYQVQRSMSEFRMSRQARGPRYLDAIARGSRVKLHSTVSKPHQQQINGDYTFMHAVKSVAVAHILRSFVFRHQRYTNNVNFECHMWYAHLYAIP